MKFIVPDYYTKFKCKAQDCQDCCCIDWEIEVDSETAKRYMELDHPFADELRASVNFGESCSFKLGRSGRCKNLDENGLCKVIKNLGEDFLPQICRDHPRYYNFSNNVNEVGLGLACEAAADIVLSIKQLPELVELDLPEEPIGGGNVSDILLEMRERFFSYLFDTNDGAKAMLTKLNAVADAELEMVFQGAFEFDKPTDRMARMLSGESEGDIIPRVIGPYFDCFGDIEVISKKFPAKVAEAIDCVRSSPEEFCAFLDAEARPYLRNLLFYFIHRYFLHYPHASYACCGFAEACALMISALVYRSGDLSHSSFVHEAVDFSKNVEYSTENVEKILTTILHME